MTNPQNGWPEYKMSVIQQLEYLTEEVKDLRGDVNQVDKDLRAMVTRDKLEAELLLINSKRETDLIAANTKRETDMVLFNKKRDELTEQNYAKINEIVENIQSLEREWAAHKGEEEKGRKVWAIIITCITITINVAGLITALLLIK